MHLSHPQSLMYATLFGRKHDRSKTIRLTAREYRHLRKARTQLHGALASLHELGIRKGQEYWTRQLFILLDLILERSGGAS